MSELSAVWPEMRNQAPDPFLVSIDDIVSMLHAKAFVLGSHTALNYKVSILVYRNSA